MNGKQRPFSDVLLSIVAKGAMLICKCSQIERDTGRDASMLEESAKV